MSTFSFMKRSTLKARTFVLFESYWMYISENTNTKKTKKGSPKIKALTIFYLQLDRPHTSLCPV